MTSAPRRSARAGCRTRVNQWLIVGPDICDLPECPRHEKALEGGGFVRKFADAVKAELPGFGGPPVKTIGDALMVRIPSSAQAVLLGLRIAHDILPGHGAPAVRVGLHHGPAIERDGDYIGAAVNL